MSAKPIGLPRTSTVALILVLNPPLLRPMAGSSPHFLSARAMLMGTHNRAVDHRVCVIGIASPVLEYLLQDAPFSPSAPASVRILPIAKPFWQITPRHSGSIPIKNRIYKQAVIGRRAANLPSRPGRKSLILSH